MVRNPLPTSLRDGVYVAVIALWLGHADIRSTDAYLHADLTIKNERWPERHQSPPNPAATGPPTSCSPSSRACDYPDLAGAVTHERPVHARPPPPTARTCRDYPGVGISRISPMSDLCDNLAANKTPAIRRWARRENAELCFMPTNASWANPVEAQSGPVQRTFVMGGPDHRNHPGLARKLQACLSWCNAHARHPGVLAAQRRERAASAANASNARAARNLKLHNRAGERSWPSH